MKTYLIIFLVLNNLLLAQTKPEVDVMRFFLDLNVNNERLIFKPSIHLQQSMRSYVPEEKWNELEELTIKNNQSGTFNLSHHSGLSVRPLTHGIATIWAVDDSFDGRSFGREEIHRYGAYLAIGDKVTRLSPEQAEKAFKSDKFLPELLPLVNTDTPPSPAAIRTPSHEPLKPLPDAPPFSSTPTTPVPPPSSFGYEWVLALVILGGAGYWLYRRNIT